MMKRRALPSAAILFILFIAAVFVVEGDAGEKSYAPSTDCKKCHERQYLSWDADMHAKSVSEKNILFTKIFDLAMEETDGALREQCLSCHAPIAVELGDLKLKKDISEEGVNCDYCHTLKGVTGTDGALTLISSPGETKYGPYDDSVTEAHKCEFSDVHTKADLCFKCHSTVKNAHGVELCATEPEWRGSPYEQNNLHCQFCHMPPIPGAAAKNGPEREKIHLHNFSGGNSSEFLTQAALVDLKVEHTDSGKKLTVFVSNLNGGHYLPTASPLRMMLLKLFAYDKDGKELWTNWQDDPLKEDSQAVFAKIITDNDGNPAFAWNATKVAFDSRLKVREKRMITYDLPAELDIVKVTANLQYKLAPDALLDRLKIDDRAFRKRYTIARAEISLSETEGTDAVVVQRTTQRSAIRTINLYAESWKFTPSEIRIKQGERVKLIISTLDDTHGFRVKDLGINVKVFTGKPVEVEIEGKKKGKYKFDCPVPCGDRCFKMKGVIIVE